MNDTPCASAGCTEPVVVVAAGVPLCASHKAKLRAELGFQPARFAAPPGRDWYVYYIAWPHMPGVVKIGASANLSSRLNSHKRDGHYPQVLAIEPGSGELETERHEQFADLRIDRLPGMFRLAPALADHIQSVSRAFPDWRDVIRPLPWWLNPAISAETFDDIPRCGAITASGNPCTYSAGHGTDHPGVGDCRHHDPAARHYKGRRRMKQNAE